MPDELKVNQSVIRLATGFIIDLNVDALADLIRHYKSSMQVAQLVNQVSKAIGVEEKLSFRKSS